MLSVTSETNNKTLQKPELAQLREKMGQIVAKTVQEIAKDTFARKRDMKLINLQNGIWYQNEYYQILKELAPSHPTAAARLKFCIDKNRFFDLHPPKHFEHVPKPENVTGNDLAQIKMKNGVIPSQALDSIIKERAFALIDCTKVCQIGQYQALYETLGKEKFDQLFSDNLTVSDYNTYTNYLLLFMKIVKAPPGEKGRRPVLLGQRVVFRNSSDYLSRHPLMGESNNYNVICLDETAGKQTFVGHGLAPEGINEDELEQLMVAERNKIPMRLDALSPQLANRLHESSQNIFGKEQYHAFCDYCESPNQETEQKLKNLTKPWAGENIKEAMEHFKKSAQPLTETPSHDPLFGYVQDITVDFNVELIQKLKAMPLKKVSLEYVFEEYNLALGNPNC